MYLVINVFTGGKTFADVDAAYCRLVNADSNQELANFLGDLEVGRRDHLRKARPPPGVTGYWHWMALGQLAHGRTAHRVAQQIAGDARMVQPAPARRPSAASARPLPPAAMLSRPPAPAAAFRRRSP